MYYSEQVCDLQGIPRTLTFEENVPRQICGTCFSVEVCIKCHVCQNWACDACTEWVFKKIPKKSKMKQKFRVIDVYCPICDARIGANFL